MSTIDYPEQTPWVPKGRSAEAAKAQEPARLTYTGTRGKLFKIALVRMLITILTLGIGRFWMVTRLRQHYWSSIRIGGDPLEYTGTALEKLIGFLIAVVILAVYLVIANLLLAFAGFAVFNGNPLAFQLQLLVLIPLGFWAQYRARRYILARTRWRGIRFGLEHGAWGYMWRALGWWLATILSLGLLYPLMQLKLSRYTTDRSSYGTLRFKQHGRLGPLMKSWMWVWLAPILLIAIGLIAAADAVGSFDLAGIEAAVEGLDDEDGESPVNPFTVISLTLLMPVLYFGVFCAWIRHQIFTFRYLNSNRVLEGGTKFEFRLGAWSVVGIYIVGWIVISLLVGIIVMLLAGVSFGAIAAVGVDPDAFKTLGGGEMPSLPALIGLGVVMLSYLPAVAAYVALGHAFITHPLIREVAMTTGIENLDAASDAAQRAHDEQAEAGGFADALGADVGGAF